MLAPLLTLLILSTSAERPSMPSGTIQGVVVSGTNEDKPLANVKVVLCANPEDTMTPVAETRTDIYGKFIFDNLLLDESVTFLPGAQLDGVQYPGNRVRLGPINTFAQTRIITFDAVESPSPLRAKKHDVQVWLKRDIMEISETLVVENRSRTTYVGKLVEDKTRETLQLSIPLDFKRVTFESEFYGRRFGIVDHRPVTNIPWPPGRRELKFTYQLPMVANCGVFRRRLDLPCEEVRVRVRGKDLKDVSCNLARKTDQVDQLEFATSTADLPAGFTIELQCGRQLINWMLYVRWSSLGVLSLLAFGTIVIYRRRDTQVSGGALEYR